MPLIEADRIVIDSVRDDTANTRNLRRRKATPNRVGNERGTEASPPKCVIDSQTADEQDGYGVRHAPPQLGARQRDPLLDSRRNCVVSNDSRWRTGVADHVRSGRQTFTSQRALPKPFVERRMAFSGECGECGDLVLGAQTFRGSHTGDPSDTLPHRARSLWDH